MRYGCPEPVVLNCAIFVPLGAAYLTDAETEKANNRRWFDHVLDRWCVLQVIGRFPALRDNEISGGLKLRIIEAASGWFHEPAIVQWHTMQAEQCFIRPEWLTSTPLKVRWDRAACRGMMGR